MSVQMPRWFKAAAPLVMFFCVQQNWTQTSGNLTFAPLDRWKRAVVAGDAALRESTALIQATFDAAPFAIAVVALDFTVLSFNRTGERMMGYPAAEIIGQSMLFMTPPHERQDAQERMRRVATGETVPSFERRRARRDGTLVDVVLSLAPVFDGEGNVHAVVLTAVACSHQSAAPSSLSDDGGLIDVNHVPGTVLSGQLGMSPAEVTQVLAATGAPKVDLLGHSQGGMMPRYYLKFLGGAQYVNALVALAPSNYGTTLDGLTTLVTDLGLAGLVKVDRGHDEQGCDHQQCEDPE